MIKLKNTHVILILAIMAVAGGVLLYLYMQRVTWDGFEYKGNIVKSQSSVPVMANPIDGVEPEHDLTAGTRIAVTGEFEDWYYIHTKNGREGWIKKTYVVGIMRVQDILDARFNFKQAVEAQQQKETKP